MIAIRKEEKANKIEDLRKRILLYESQKMEKERLEAEKELLQMERENAEFEASVTNGDNTFISGIDENPRDDKGKTFVENILFKLFLID